MIYIYNTYIYIEIYITHIYREIYIYRDIDIDGNRQGWTQMNIDRNRYERHR